MTATRKDDRGVRVLVNPSTGMRFHFDGGWLRDSPAQDGDIRRGLARFRGDKVWLSFPPGVQAQLDKGALVVDQDYDAREEVRHGEADTGPVMPQARESREAWITYAVAQGMSRDEAEVLTKAQIRQRFEEPEFDPDSPPDLDG